MGTVRPQRLLQLDKTGRGKIGRTAKYDIIVIAMRQERSKSAYYNNRRGKV